MTVSSGTIIPLILQAIAMHGFCHGKDRTCAINITCIYFVEIDALVILRSGQFAAVAGFWEDDAYTHGQNIKDDAYTRGTARFEEHEGVYRSVGGPDIGDTAPRDTLQSRIRIWQFLPYNLSPRAYFAYFDREGM